MSISKDFAYLVSMYVVDIFRVQLVTPYEPISSHVPAMTSTQKKGGDVFCLFARHHSSLVVLLSFSCNYKHRSISTAFAMLWNKLALILLMLASEPKTLQDAFMVYQSNFIFYSLLDGIKFDIFRSSLG